MTSQFRSIVLLPTIFIVVFLGAVLGSKSYLAFIILCFLLGEHLYSWNKSINGQKFQDFRVFFTDQYFKIIYTGLTLLIYLISSIFWDFINYWSFFGYAANFIIYRSLANEGTSQINSLPNVESRPVVSSFDEWENNKYNLEMILDRSSDKNLVFKIKDQLDYSGFLRTPKAKILIEQAKNSSSENLNDILEKINNLL